MLDSFANILKVEELRKKLLFTVMALVVFRCGKYLPTPGINLQAIADAFNNADPNSPMSQLMSLADMFTGGALRAGAIFGLGIMPYITSSIIFQLLCGIHPVLGKMQREPEGSKKIVQWTRVVTVGLCLVQGVLICGYLLQSRGAPDSYIVPAQVMSDFEFYFYGVTSLTVGTIFLMWLGEQIDVFGIGNGASFIIMAGIVAQLPGTLSLIFHDINTGGMGAGGEISFGELAILFAMFVGMVLAVVLLTLGQRRIPVQQAKATRGRRVYGGERSYLPLRVNQGGVIPIIFAQSILMIPNMIASSVGIDTFSIYGYWYNVFYIAMIIFFCYFYAAITFNPKEMADNLQTSGAFIPGVRAGKRTAEHIEHIMTHIALAGSIFLSFVAIVPEAVSGIMDVRYQIASFLGGTGLLIVVGVALDTVQRIEKHLMSRNYEGFVKGGRGIRGRQ